MEKDKSGYDFFADSSGALYGAANGGEYVDKVTEQINELVNNINQFNRNGTATAVAQLKGNVAEWWHSGTFNINAALKGSNLHTNVPHSNAFGSADITTSWGEDVGLKYYQTAKESAKWQAESVYQRFMASKGNDFVEYCAKRGISEETIHRSIYEGQLRIIPSEQLEGAKEWLNRKILEESVKRPEQAERYRETLARLSDRISHEGIESDPLTNDKAIQAAVQGKNGTATAENLGVSIEQKMTGEYILGQAMQAGAVAAAISLALKIAPVIISMIKKKKETGELSDEDFKKLGISALGGSSEGFIRGSISAGLTISCKSGILGESLKEVAPPVIGALVTVIINTMKNGFFVATGKMRAEELADNFGRDVTSAGFSVVLGAAGNCLLPGVGLFIGSLVGSMIGTAAYNGISYYSREVFDRIHRQAAYFDAYASELTRIDLRDFVIKTEFFNKAAYLIETSDSAEDLNRSLHSVYDRLGLSFPWQGDFENFDNFMGNNTNKLTFG